MTSFVKIEGKIQNYSWGGDQFIADLLGTPADSSSRLAEYWLGAHGSAPSVVFNPGHGPQSVTDFLQARKAGDMRFLFKVLDVRDMLSIQVHPSKIQARHGYDRENAAGIPLTAKNRNYRDRSDKPEMMVALSPFWLLHGFRQPEAIQAELSRKPYLQPLLDCLNRFGLVATLQMALNHFSPSVQTMHKALLADFQGRTIDADRSRIDYWIDRWVKSNPNIVNGILTLFFLNLVKLEPGQGIYQPPGLLHAYLEGQNIELMASSDNVLRAGLTAKHVDVPELLAISSFEPSEPETYRVKEEIDARQFRLFKTPIREFELSEINADRGRHYRWQSDALELLFCYAGGAEITSTDGQRDLIIKGQSILVLPQQSLTLQCDSDAIFFRATNRL